MYIGASKSIGMGIRIGAYKRVNNSQALTIVWLGVAAVMYPFIMICAIVGGATLGGAFLGVTALYVVLGVNMYIFVVDGNKRAEQQLIDNQAALEEKIKQNQLKYEKRQQKIIDDLNANKAKKDKCVIRNYIGGNGHHYTKLISESEYQNLIDYRTKMNYESSDEFFMSKDTPEQLENKQSLEAEVSDEQLNKLKEMGFQFKEINGKLVCDADKLIPNNEKKVIKDIINKLKEKGYNFKEIDGKLICRVD